MQGEERMATLDRNSDSMGLYERESEVRVGMENRWYGNSLIKLWESTNSRRYGS